MRDDYAWVDSEYQFKTSGILKMDSLVRNKNTISYCRPPSDFRNNLLPGRNCTHDTQCLSGSCNKFGICAGKPINEPCANSNECHLGLSCIPDKRWPF